MAVPNLKTEHVVNVFDSLRGMMENQDGLRCCTLNSLPVSVRITWPVG